MTFFEQLMSQFNFVQCMELLLRVVVAGACGVALGYERTKRFKNAGMRTLFIISTTAAVLMIISKYCFGDLGGAVGIEGADPSRIASIIVSGVGFLGAGVIFKSGNSIKGLTTAACIWSTAAVGMCMGSGLYWLGIFFTLLMLAVQHLLHKIEVGNDAVSVAHISITVADRNDALKFIDKLVSGHKIKVFTKKISKNSDGTLTIEVEAKFDKATEVEDILTLVESNPDVLTISFQ